MQFINNEISTTNKCLVKNEVDNNYDINFPCKATDTSNNTKTMDCSLNKTIENDSEKNIHKLRRFDCNICQRRFITKSNIIRHIAKSHSSTSIEKKAPQKNKVNHRNSRIKKYTQNKDGLFNCGICVKTFSSKSNLRRHWRIHTGEKPYKCDDCIKRFGQISHLKIHERIHTGEKPYKCVVCEKTSIQHSDLKRHARVHTGEKLFKCVVCEKAFIEESNLKRHSVDKFISSTMHVFIPSRIRLNAMSVKKRLVDNITSKLMNAYILVKTRLNAMSVKNVW
ncbi:zinc finger protein 888-like [Adelges cooleyi]|uniref:zinc finger protein 888-like n=1 Tax=Adelges cooleyi TaxID=133065 RepID=UPI00218026C0|nr:zinc finger protein 888-like [Adelges cooleyi]